MLCTCPFWFKLFHLNIGRHIVTRFRSYIGAETTRWWRVNHYASRSGNTLSLRRTLALTWACERFATYLHGMKEFHARTDHKLLIVVLGEKQISGKSLGHQWFKLRLLSFNFKIVRVGGKDFFAHDTLSRAPLDESTVGRDVLDQIHLNQIVKTFLWRMLGWMKFSKSRKRNKKLEY